MIQHILVTLELGLLFTSP